MWELRQLVGCESPDNYEQVNNDAVDLNRYWEDAVKKEH